MALRSTIAKSINLNAAIVRTPWSSRAFAFSATRPSQNMSKQGAQDIIDAAGKVKKTVEDLREKANLAAATVIGKAVQGGGKAVDASQDIGEKAKQVAQNAWEAAKDTTQKVVDTVVDKASDAKDAIKDTVENATHTVKRTVNNIKN